ncbi:hypothetical protein EGW08_016035, partial [Elysia chlorotica]
KVTCRAGFWPVGSKCYKLVREPVDWQSAALYCGSHGASLARYDTLADKPLKIFLKMMQKFLAQAETEECVDTDTKCVEKAQSGECQAKPHWMIPNCRKSCGMCKSSTPLVPWVAGNTKVIPFGLRKGNVSLQIDVSLRAESKNERGCYPAPNHFICRCPPGSMYSEYLKKCTDFCGECYAWGDPHYKSLSNVHFNFMGMCRFKFNGVCNKNKFGDKPNYDVYTTNVQCINGWRRDASCLSAVEVHLRNIPVTLPCGAQSKQTMVFKVKVRESHYQLDGQNVTTQIVDKPGVYKAVIRPRYFSLVVHAVGLTVLLNNGHLRVRAPDQFKGEMCGLCGDCGTEDYVMRNGSTVSVPKLNEKNYIEEEINPVGLSWMELTPEFKDMQCGLSPLKDNCTSAAKRRLHGADLCGVFGQKNGSIADCFNIAKLDRRQFWIDCIFDLCELEDPTQAVCEEVAAFAQQCIARGVPVDWRTPEFCPMTCPADMVYRVDASGQKTCGQRAGAMATLNEEPAEGCVCRDGLYRLGDKCVPPCMCPTDQ